MDENAITLFAQPRELSGLIGYIDEKDRQALQLNEIAYMGGRLVLVPKQGDVASAIAFDFVVKSTTPTTGLAKRWEAMRPLASIPEISLPNVARVIAFNFEPQRNYESYREMFNAKHGTGEYENLIERDSKVAAGLSVKDHTYIHSRKSNGFLEVRYETPSGWEAPLFMDRVNDKDAMRRFLDLEIEKVNKVLGKPAHHYKPAEIGDAVLWIQSETAEDLAARWRKNGDGLRANDVDVSYYKSVYALDEQFCYRGINGAVEQQLGLTAASGSLDLCAKLAFFQKLLGVDGKPCYLQYRSKSGWRHELNRLQDMHIKRKYGTYDRQLEEMKKVAASADYHIEIESPEDRMAVCMWAIAREFVNTQDDQLLWIDAPDKTGRFVLRAIAVRNPR